MFICSHQQTAQPHKKDINKLPVSLFLTYGFIFIMHFSLIAQDLDSLLVQAQKATDPVEQMERYIELGDRFEYTHPDRAISYYKEAYEVSNVVRESTRNRSLIPKTEILRAKSLRYMGIVQSDQGNYQEALENYFEAKKTLDDARSAYTAVARDEIDLKTAKLLNNIGIVFSHQSLFEVAKEYYLEALAVYEELADQNSIAVVYNSLGIIEARQANITEALRYFRHALDIYKQQNNQEGVAQTYNNIGNVNLYHGNYEEALALFFKAYDGFSEMKYIHRMAATLNNIALIYQRLGDFEEAVLQFQESIRMREEINDQRGLTEGNNNLGNLYLDMEDFERADQCFQNSYEISKTLGDNHNLATAYINMGRVAFHANNPGSAIQYTYSGLEIAQEHNLNFIISSALYRLGEFYAHLGDFENAFHYSRRHFELSQEILDEQKTRQISEIEVGYQAREKQQKIEFLEQEKQINSLRLRQSGTLVFVLVLLFLVVVIVGIFTMLFLKQRSKIQLLQKERESAFLLQKTDNDLKAVLKSHAHAMLLFDVELNVIGLNDLAQKWFENCLGKAVALNDSFYSVSHPIANDLINDQLFHALRGESQNQELEIVNPDNKKCYYKVFCNPVFDENDEIVQSVSLMIEDITQRRDSEVKIIADLQEKETLIKEIHHRVKNNMQVIISLIRLQSNEISEVALKESFCELEQRVAAMSYVHEELYKSDNLSDINFEDYLHKISTNLISIFNRSVRVNNTIHIKNSLVNIDIAVPCGLVVNELLSNSLKHAFPLENNKPAKNNNSKVDINFIELEDGYELSIEDNGKGLDEKLDLTKINTMGLHLVKIIVEEQLRGKWAFKNQDGLKVSVTFPKTA